MIDFGLYAQGVAKLRTFDALGARDLLEQAIKADPQYAMAHSALAEAWLTLGYDARAAQEAERAYKLSEYLGLEQRLMIEGRLHESAHQWKDATAAYRTLFDHYPDNVDYGLRLAQLQRKGAEYPGALETARALKKLTPPLKDDPRVDLEEARAYLASGDLAGARSSALSAEREAKSRGAYWLAAQATLFREGEVEWGFVGTGKMRESVAELENVRREFESMGDLNGSAWALLYAARVQSDEPDATGRFEEAYQRFERIGNARGMADAQHSMGAMQWKTGDLEGARRSFARARLNCESIADNSCVRAQIMGEGNIAFMEGDIRGAERKFRDALAVAEDSGDVFGAFWALGNLAEALQLKGDLNGALKIYRDNVEKTRGQELTWGRAGDMAKVGVVLTEQGQFAEARHIFEQTQAMEPIPGAEGNRATTDAARSLAILDIAEHHPAAAEAILRSRAEFFAAKNRIDVTVDAYDLLAQSLLAQGKIGEAQSATAEARRMMGKWPAAYFALHLEVTEAQVAIASSPHDARIVANALASERGVMTQARKDGMMKLELEARLAEGEIEIQSGAVAAGRAHLANLERDAKAKGFGLIAQEASSKRTIVN